MANSNVLGEGSFAVLNLKPEYDNVSFSDMDRVYYRSINNIANNAVVLVKKSDNTVKTIWWD
jgi:hypothetical protein